MEITPGLPIELPRGGTLLDTSAGYLQVGSPPETIKDTMAFPKGVPLVFILPEVFFSRERGISVAEVEFPLYFNFFIRKRKTTILCSESQVRIFEQVLNESLFGPPIFNLQNEFDEKSDRPIPDLKAEIAHFRGKLLITDLVDFRIFGEDRQVVLGDTIVRIEKDHDFTVTDPLFPQGVRLPGRVEYRMTYDLGNVGTEPFAPPVFGITCLGPSHGFDPVDNTSGFLLWINRRGIMVDPPVNSTEWLVRSNVDPKLIDSIILTHTHADHDAGTMQKVLEGDRVTIYTTQTVMDGWLRKYSALTGIPPTQLSQYFDFHPVLIGQKHNIHGAWFEFHYALHSLPTMGFRFHYRDKSFVYSSDHLNLPEKFDELLEKGVVSKERHAELSNFPWDADIIYHEAGVPPLHTPVSRLNALPIEVQKKITCYHIARKDFPTETNLNLATFGIAATRVVEVKQGDFESAFQILDVLSRVEIFKSFTLEEVRDLVAVVNRETFPAGARILTRGTPGDKFYVITSGTTRIGEGDADSKRFGSYQTFGEVSLILDTPRTADVFAETDVTALTIGKSAFLNLIEGTEIQRTLRKVALNRDQNTWEALSESDLWPKLSSSQKTDLEVLLERIDVKEDSTLFSRGEILDELLVFHGGEAWIEDAEGNRLRARKGAILGVFKEFQLGLPSTLSCGAKAGSLVFRLGADAFRKYLKKNPGVYLRFFEALTR